MFIFGCKVLFVTVYLLQAVLVFGQPTDRPGQLKQIDAVNEYLELRLNQLRLAECEGRIFCDDWLVESEVPKRFIGITHVPAIDFNIYLSFNSSITPNILTSFEVSLNYAGVMNIKSLIVLRKQ